MTIYSVLGQSWAFIVFVLSLCCRMFVFERPMWFCVCHLFCEFFELVISLWVFLARRGPGSWQKTWLLVSENGSQVGEMPAVPAAPDEKTAFSKDHCTTRQEWQRTIQTMKLKTNKIDDNQTTTNIFIKLQCLLGSLLDLWLSLRIESMVPRQKHAKKHVRYADDVPLKGIVLYIPWLWYMKISYTSSFMDFRIWTITILVLT